MCKRLVMVCRSVVERQLKCLSKFPLSDFLTIVQCKYSTSNHRERVNITVPHLPLYLQAVDKNIHINKKFQKKFHHVTLAIR